MFPKKVLAEINKIRVPEDRMKKLEYIPNQERPGSGFVFVPSGGLSIHEFLRFEIMKLGEKLGFFPYPELHLSEIHGTIESGSVDVTWVDFKKEKKPRFLFAFEIERHGRGGNPGRSCGKTLKT